MPNEYFEYYPTHGEADHLRRGRKLRTSPGQILDEQDVARMAEAILAQLRSNRLNESLLTVQPKFFPTWAVEGF